MPFDSVTFKLPAVKPTTFDPVLREGLAGLAQLSEALRHPEWWEARDHRWRFSHCLRQQPCGTTGCAIGVACVLWPAQTRSWLPNPFGDEDVIGSALGLTFDEAHRLFLASQGPAVQRAGSIDAVTPAHVADAIDALLAAKGWKG
jgi:hypothetical protein